MEGGFLETALVTAYVGPRGTGVMDLCRTHRCGFMGLPKGLTYVASIWALKGLPYHDFEVYVCIILLPGNYLGGPCSTWVSRGLLVSA